MELFLKYIIMSIQPPLNPSPLGPGPELHPSGQQHSDLNSRNLIEKN